MIAPARRDAEHYNYFRDYDPSIGRYVESDPIGLAGGINTFSYVQSSSLVWTDPRGLARKLDPSGEECQKLAKKIENIRRDIKDGQDAISFSPRDLPLLPPHPGAPNRASVSGHQLLVDFYKQNLQGRLKEYEDKCGCGPDCPYAKNTANQGDSGGRAGVARVGAGAATACVAICVLQPESCPLLLLGFGIYKLAQ